MMKLEVNDVKKKGKKEETVENNIVRKWKNR